MPSVSTGTPTSHTGWLQHRFHGNIYEFKKNLTLNKLTVYSDGQSAYNASAIVVKLSDVANLPNGTDIRSYSVLNSTESKVVNGATSFTFPVKLLEKSVPYLIGISFDNEQSGNGIGITTAYNESSTYDLNADITLKATNVKGNTLNHATSYYMFSNGTPFLHSWSGQPFSQILEYDTNLAGRTFTWPTVSSELRPGDVINVNYTGKIEDISNLRLGQARVQLYGASGGIAAENSPGGYGGYSEAIVNFNGKPAFIAIGGTPGRSSSKGFNGGGESDINNNVGGGGGGASDVRINGNNLSNRILVAGGGGGGGYENGSYQSGGGHGGGANRPGIAGNKNMSQGGQLNIGGNYGATFGQGASYNSPGVSGGSQNGNGAGGGGWYGGGMANSNGEDYAGAGGSGYADTSVCSSIIGIDGGIYGSQSGGTSYTGNGKAVITIISVGGFIQNDVTISEKDIYKKETLETVRNNVNLLRQNFSLPTANWAEPIIIKNVTPIKASHWNEIEQNIKDVYNVNNIPFTDNSVESQFVNPIKANDKKNHPLHSLGERLKNINKALKNS